MCNPGWRAVGWQRETATLLAVALRDEQHAARTAVVPRTMSTSSCVFVRANIRSPALARPGVPPTVHQETASRTAPCHTILETNRAVVMRDCVTSSRRRDAGEQGAHLLDFVLMLAVLVIPGGCGSRWPM